MLYGQAIHPLCKRYIIYNTYYIITYKITDSGSFSLVIYKFPFLLFNYSLTVLYSIAHYIIFSLRGWFPYIQISFLSFYFILL